MRGEFIKRKGHNQAECRKLLRCVSSRIGFSRDTGIEKIHLKAHVDRYFSRFAEGRPRTYLVFVFSSRDHCDAHHDIDAFCEHLVLMKRR